MQPGQITDMWLWPAADYEPYRWWVSDVCPLKKLYGELQLLHEAEDDAVKWLESTVYSDFSIHEMKWNEWLWWLLRYHLTNLTISYGKSLKVFSKGTGNVSEFVEWLSCQILI